jgi:hypothetical protein
VKNLVGSVTRGTRVTIQTPLGPQTFDLSKPGAAEALARLKESLKSAQFDYTSGPRPSTPGQFVQAGIAQIPGGWATIALVGAALLMFSGGLGLGRVGRRR